MRVTFLVVILFYSFSLCGQSISEAQIKELAEQVNQKLKNVDVGNGIIARGCISIGRTIVYQYDVPSNWIPPENLKEEVIANLKTAGVAKTYFNYDIDVDFYYFKGNSLIKKISIFSNELSNYNYNLNEYLSIKNHPKAKGVNLKVKVPHGWNIEEGDRPNIVKKFTKNGNTYLILIRDNMTFFSRGESRELLENEDFLNEFVIESISFMKDPELIDKKVITIDTYPTMTFLSRGKMERMGVTIPVIMRCWVIFYEDKIVFLQSMGIDNAEFRALEKLYFLITNSVIFPDQYD